MKVGEQIALAPALRQAMENVRYKVCAEQAGTTDMRREADLAQGATERFRCDLKTRFRSPSREIDRVGSACHPPG